MTWNKKSIGNEPNTTLERKPPLRIADQPR